MQPNERAAIFKLKRELEKALNLVDYRVFGSKARYEESPESDIDVMIEVENYTPEVETLIDELVFEINLDHDCLISAVIFGSKELHEGPLRESLSRRDTVGYFITSVPLFSKRGRKLLKITILE